MATKFESLLIHAEVHINSERNYFYEAEERRELEAIQERDFVKPIKAVHIRLPNKGDSLNSL